jgi:preprotein translocase subunit SecE
MANITPSLFIRQVRQEVAKVTWLSRKETGVWTLMVFVMVIFASVFFLLVDLFFGWSMKLIFGSGA